MTKYANRVAETTQTTGTGTMDLDGAQTGFRAFSDELTTGDEVYYGIEDDPANPTEYEFGIGTWTNASPDTLSRDTIHGSSNGGAKISLQAGTTYTVSAVVTKESLAQSDGTFFINETANGNMTVGLTINQGATDNEILSLKSNDIAHGVTGETETDTFGMFKKNSGTGGGLLIQGLAENTNVIGLRFRVLGDDDTDKSTSAEGITVFHSTVNDGTSSAATPGANSNLVVFRSGTAARFIFDAEGDSHQDVGTAWTNFDDHDDAAILQDLSFAVSKPTDPIRETFSDFLQYNHEKLEALGLVQFNDDGHHFVNMSKLTMLHTGAIRQLAVQLQGVMQRLTVAESRLVALPN